MNCFFKVGQKATVREDIVPDDCTLYYMHGFSLSNSFVDGMQQFCGKSVTISEIENGQYFLEEDVEDDFGCRHYWTDEMFEEFFSCGNDVRLEELMQF